MADLFENPLGTRGFAFVEFAAPNGDVGALKALFSTLGFTAVARHRSEPISVYRQGEIRFLVNESTTGQAGAFTAQHGPGASAMGFLVDDQDAAFAGALERGATTFGDGLWTDGLPAIEGIGGSALYLMTKEAQDAFYAEHFEPLPGADAGVGAGLVYLDHLTHNVHRGNMAKWAEFYERIFNFREIRYFDIEGKLTGLLSKAMTSPDGNIRIPLNESQDENSQIEEFLRDYNGEGIQHIALGAADIYTTVEALRARGVPFQDTPDTYFDGVDARVAGHTENVEQLRKNRILIDGAPTDDQGVLLQIFTQNAIGPIFFEIIQRKGNEGFGEGNFQALFESIELDQIRRGVLAD